jgi:hypothetical protein
MIANITKTRTTAEKQKWAVHLTIKAFKEISEVTIKRV